MSIVLFLKEYSLFRDLALRSREKFNIVKSTSKTVTVTAGVTFLKEHGYC